MRNAMQRFATLRRNPVLMAFYVFLILLMSNLNALVDAVLHPEIPYFDKEHLVVGGLTGLVTVIAFGALAVYAIRLERAIKKIRRLESILPICARCKKIRLADSDPKKQDSWQDIDLYIRQKTDTQFTHGICPSCSNELYPLFSKENQKNNDRTGLPIDDSKLSTPVVKHG